MKRLFLSLLCVLSLGLPLGAATNYKEGSGSADFEEADYERFEILDADLSSKVPLKSGDTNKKVSWTFWFPSRVLRNYAPARAPVGPQVGMGGGRGTQRESGCHVR